jgi:DNA topoisomerase 2-associated protein PAT1
MSFFGFDSNLPRDRGHASNAPGFGQHDAFAGLASGGAGDDDMYVVRQNIHHSGSRAHRIDFEETYDGHGNPLDDADDAFNDDTFGGPQLQQSVDKHFDFAGQTSKVSNVMQEEQMLYQARQGPSQQYRPPVPQASKPNRSGYESYKDPEYIPQLEARADIWGLKPKQQTQQAPQSQYEPQPPQHAPQTAPARKLMSLDEVEAMMRAQSIGNEPRGHTPSQQAQFQGPPQGYPSQQFPHGQPPFPGMHGGPPGHYAPQILQRPHQQQHPQQHQHQQHQQHQQQQQHQHLQQQYQQQQHQSSPRQQPVRAELPAQPVPNQGPQHPTILQRQKQQPREQSPQPQQTRQAPPQNQQQNQQRGPSSQPRQILQNPDRLSGHGQPMAQSGSQPQRGQSGQGGQASGHNRGPSYPGMVITHPEQLLQLSETERAAFLEEDAKRAKRNHKIALLAKDNGLMTPQDKNFITRIQLQQLMTATGNLDERGPEAAIAEDFYYQVFSQIRGAPRQNPQQPASQFAQTYLFQTNNRFGARRNGRGGDNHMQRMEQQIQRAVEAAKARPKARQLVVEGSLGKIAFSNSKTPRPLLNIKRSEVGDKHLKHLKSSGADRKEALRNIENVYATLMQMEDHERTMPPPINESSNPDAIQAHMEWRSKIDTLHQKLWRNTKIMEPLVPK